MELIVKNKNIKDADAFLFGFKGLSTYDECITLEELKKLSYEKFYIALDKNMFNDDLPLLEETLVSLNELGIKGIFFYDLSVLSISKKLGITIPLIWNQDFLVTNYKTCNYYYNEGVSGGVLSSVITIDEIIEICNNTKMDLFVNIFGYQLMAISKRKLVSNYFEYIGEDNSLSVNYMKERTGTYPILENDVCTKFYNKDILSGIRYIPRLKEAGIKHIILDGTLIDDEIFSLIVSYYKEDGDIESIERNISNLLDTSLGFFDKKTIYRVKK